MVAEFSGELPPDVAQAVREHIAICETCGARAIALRTPYNLLSSLGAEPVPYVPDLRDHVRKRAAIEKRWLGPLRALTSIGRFSLLSIGLGVVLIALLVLVLRGALTSIGVFTTARTTNAIAHPAPAAPAGTLFAETDKLVTVSGASGQSWQVAEVIVTDQRTGHVIHSLPASQAALAAGSASTLPVAIATDGKTVYELTSAQNGGKQALVAIDAATGATRFILPLAQPKGAALPAGAQALSLTLSPDGQTAYVGLGGANGKLLSVRALVIETSSGKVTAAYNPATVTTAPLPAPTSSLPASAFPSQTPQVDLSKMTFSEAAGGALVVSPDGQWLYDALSASDSHGVQYLIVRRISAASGETAQVLGLPGPFHSERLAISPSTTSGELYVVSGSPDAIVYVMDTSAQGPTLLGDIALGGPTTTNGARLADSLSVSPTADGQRIYVTEDAASSDGVVTAHTRWLLDTQGMGVVASDSEGTSVGALLANTSTSASAKVFALVNGDIQIGAPDFSSKWSPWLHASDGAPVLRLIASEP
jgi:anti-sigma factor RsiW